MITKIENGIEIPLTIEELAEYDARIVEHEAYINSPEFKKEQFNLKNQEILIKLDEIDRKSIRAMRSNDSQRLQSLEQEAVQLRSQFVL